jgi:benzodiazapine receptor
MKKVKWGLLLGLILLCQSAGFFGALFTTPAIPTWYASLNKPPVTPPNWLFMPMWLSLYTLMGIALYLVWDKKKNCLAKTLFFIQLGLNALWSMIFFGFHQLVLGLVEIIFLDFFVIATIIEFRDLDRRAGYILFPYLAWLTAATILNLTVAWFNPA